jgi:hypothetical protein
MVSGNVELSLIARMKLGILGKHSCYGRDLFVHG